MNVRKIWAVCAALVVLPASVLAYEDLEAIVLPAITCATNPNTGACTSDTVGQICDDRDRKTCQSTVSGCRCR
jgi:hypothetical protein